MRQHWVPRIASNIQAKCTTRQFWQTIPALCARSVESASQSNTDCSEPIGRPTWKRHFILWLHKVPTICNILIQWHHSFQIEPSNQLSENPAGVIGQSTPLSQTNGWSQLTIHCAISVITLHIVPKRGING